MGLCICVDLFLSDNVKVSLLFSLILFASLEQSLFWGDFCSFFSCKLWE